MPVYRGHRSYVGEKMIRHSVIIPTSNHPSLLHRCLATLRKAKRPTAEYEVLVMDNSEEAYRSENLLVTASFNDDRFRYVPMEDWGLMAARHLGVEMARGHIVSFIDDDSFVSDTWFLGIEESLNNSNVVLVTGPNRPEYEITPPDWLDYFCTKTENGHYMVYLSLLDFGDTIQEIEPTFVWGCNYSIRKEIFYAVKGSHPDYLPPQWRKYQGDGEVGLSVKVAALGFEVRYCPKCAIRHLVPASRMTLDYLGARAFIFGIEDSFRRARREHGLGPSEGVAMDPEARQVTLYRQLRLWASKTWIGSIKRNLFPSKESLIEPPEVVEIRHHLKKCFANGWTFHRHALHNDPKLKEYVLRPNYMGENAKIR